MDFDKLVNELKEEKANGVEVSTPATGMKAKTAVGASYKELKKKILHAGRKQKISKEFKEELIAALNMESADEVISTLLDIILTSKVKLK